MKAIIIVSFVLCCSLSFAQQHATEHTQCQMNMDEILRLQSFNMDDPISEHARNVFYDLYENLNRVYKCSSDSKQCDEQISDFEKTIEKAERLNLNLKMFEEDIHYVSKLTR
ncbi:MAG: hypothetical protein WEA99_02385 [Brumimicrobium sp.]